jgi:ABC-type methionine transport system permease subunit
MIYSKVVKNWKNFTSASDLALTNKHLVNPFKASENKYFKNYEIYSIASSFINILKKLNFMIFVIIINEERE